MPLLAELQRGVTTSSAEETQALASRFAASLEPDVTLALHGNLGAGKTTFVQGLARGFGISDAVTSPTFTIYTVHRGPSRTLVHLDAYRLEQTRDIDSLLVEDFLVTPWCLAIEWPEKIAGWLSPATLHLDLGITPDERHTVRLR